jgi:hypothetical protein
MERFYKRKAQDSGSGRNLCHPDDINWEEERIFSGMKIVKTTLSNRMGDTHS